MRRVNVIILLAVLLVLAPATASATTTLARGPQDCAAALDCTLDEIDAMSMADRLAFVRLVSEGPAAEFLPGTDPGRWRNIEGIITMFDNHDVGAPGSWVSYTDAGILEGLQRGLAIASGRNTDTGGNPGSARWADYLTRLAAGELSDRAAHDRAWSEAEQAATDHGLAVAEQHNAFPSPTESHFFDNSQIYRNLLRNRPPFIELLPSLQPGCAEEGQNVYDWATDVTNAESGRTGAELLWMVAEKQVGGALLDTIDVLRAYFGEMCEQYPDAVSGSAGTARS